MAAGKKRKKRRGLLGIFTQEPREKEEKSFEAFIPPSELYRENVIDQEKILSDAVEVRKRGLPRGVRVIGAANPVPFLLEQGALEEGMKKGIKRN